MIEINEQRLHLAGSVVDSGVIAAREMLNKGLGPVEACDLLVSPLIEDATDMTVEAALILMGVAVMKLALELEMVKLAKEIADNGQ